MENYTQQVFVFALILCQNNYYRNKENVEYSRRYENAVYKIGKF